MSRFIEIDEEWTEAQATRKYSSHKSWHNRYLKKIQGLYLLLDKAFDRVMEESLNENLIKCFFFFIYSKEGQLYRELYNEWKQDS